MKEIRWGIIGCGTVTERKSGPAFNQVSNSKLVAVMRRDASKAADYARRHDVSKWYSNADELIEDKDINAIYIATPPDTHAEYTIKAAKAGKAVYVEKPMALNYNQCLQMIEFCKSKNVPLFVAYYRRALPYFMKIKELIFEQTIGTVKFVDINLFAPARNEDYRKENLPWRVKPEISGSGGYFYDLASHQIDLLQLMLGKIISYQGYSQNCKGLYPADDTFIAQFGFESGVYGSGKWCFDVEPISEKDTVTITGTHGSICFSGFKFTPIKLKTVDREEEFNLPPPENIQLPFIKSMVNELQGGSKCASDLEIAAHTNLIMESIVKK